MENISLENFVSQLVMFLEICICDAFKDGWMAFYDATWGNMMKNEKTNPMHLENYDEDINDDDDGCELHEFGQLGWMLYKGNGSLGGAAIVRGHTI